MMLRKAAAPSNIATASIAELEPLDPRITVVLEEPPKAKAIDQM